MAYQRYQKTNRESVPSYSIRDMSAHPVSQAGIRWIDQLAGTLRQRGVPAPLLRMTLNTLHNAGALVMGKIFIMLLLERLSNLLTVLSTSPTMKVGRAY